MKFKIIILILFVSILSVSSSWTVFPWVLKTENNIKVKFIPDKLRNNIGTGITKVYKKQRLLYSIDKFFTSLILLDSTGKYFVKIHSGIYRDGSRNNSMTDENGITTSNIERHEGKALEIYRNGKFQYSLNFEDFEIDTSKLDKTPVSFYWLSNNDLLKECPAYISNDTLNIFTIDKQILTVSLATGKLVQTVPLVNEDISDLAKRLPKMETRRKRIYLKKYFKTKT